MSLVYCNDSIGAEENLSIKQMLLTPGDLAKAHAHLESQCKKCHENFERSNQSPLCLDCHKSIHDDITKKQRFHGHLSQAQTENCKSCHSDHLGKDADIVGLDKDNFDHGLTGFKLHGAHQKIECIDCHNNRHHQSEKKFTDFRVEKHQCVDCHVDVHKGKLGSKCSKCHSESRWKKTAFDHDKTDFPLLGKHKNLVCSQCHQNHRYKDTSTNCISCHLSKDKHFGVMGEKCQDCHSEKGWGKTKFNHNKQTHFSLSGRHESLACEACHRKNLPLKLSQQCIDCHREDDIHKGSNGDKCQNCHNEKSWGKSNFDHNKDTEFALIGAHKDVSCHSCHKVDSKGETSVAGDQCIDCHKTIDPHHGSLGKDCASCHQQIAWNRDTQFDHDFSKFPLTGAHKTLLCENCHFDENFQKVSHQCQQCHSGNDIHEGTLGKDCAHCHNTVSFSSWEFNHNKQTKFILDGAHQNLQCSLCHRQDIPDPVHPSTTCNSCHQQDDIHHGDFGPDCEQCHSTEVFDDVR